MGSALLTSKCSLVDGPFRSPINGFIKNQTGVAELRRGLGDNERESSSAYITSGQKD
jgi:hypothetical protein